jgi:hypothetical protein
MALSPRSDQDPNCAENTLGQSVGSLGERHYMCNSPDDSFKEAKSEAPLDAFVDTQVISNEPLWEKVTDVDRSFREADPDWWRRSFDMFLYLLNSR